MCTQQLPLACQTPSHVLAHQICNDNTKGKWLGGGQNQHEHYHGTHTASFSFPSRLFPPPYALNQYFCWFRSIGLADMAMAPFRSYTIPCVYSTSTPSHPRRDTRVYPKNNGNESTIESISNSNVCAKQTQELYYSLCYKWLSVNCCTWHSCAVHTHLNLGCGSNELVKKLPPAFSCQATVVT